jgi:hypothetical protein
LKPRRERSLLVPGCLYKWLSSAEEPEEEIALENGPQESPES